MSLLSDATDLCRGSDLPGTMSREDDTRVNSTEGVPEPGEVFLAYPKKTSDEPNPVMVVCTKVETSELLDGNGEKIFYIYFKAGPGNARLLTCGFLAASS